MGRILLILDLDDTLIHGAEQPLGPPADFMCGPYSIYVRPGVCDFVKAIRDVFDVAVWSSATKDYVECIVDKIFGADYPLEFVWSRERCTAHNNHETRELEYIKDLKKIARQGRDLDRVLMIDDDAGALRRNYGNLIRINPYSGDPNDTELQALLGYIPSLAEASDVRQIEKRAWRQRVTGK